MKIGIFGGTLSPSHNEHVALCRSVVAQFGLDKLIVCPSNVSPHKTHLQIAPFNHRFNMAQLAFGGETNVEISNFEYQNGAVSYTYITLEHFKSVYPDAQFFFLVGTDMLADFCTWKNPQRILDVATLIVTPRQGDDLDCALNVYHSHFSKQVLVSDYTGANVSSTKIRIFAMLGQDVSAFVPKPVADYIAKNNVYEGDSFYQYVRQNLPQKRLAHTANVIVKAVELAKQTGADVKKVELAALLHDIAKYEKVESYAGFEYPLKTYMPVPEQIRHQYLGAFIAQTKLGVTDEEVLDAIRYHTTARPNMGLVEKIVFLADLIEDTRDYCGVDGIRRLTKQNFEKGFAFSLTELLKYLTTSEQSVYNLTFDAQKFYC